MKKRRIVLASLLSAMLSMNAIPQTFVSANVAGDSPSAVQEKQETKPFFISLHDTDEIKNLWNKIPASVEERKLRNDKLRKAYSALIDGFIAENMGDDVILETSSVLQSGAWIVADISMARADELQTKDGVLSAWEVECESGDGILPNYVSIPGFIKIYDNLFEKITGMNDTDTIEVEIIIDGIEDLIRASKVRYGIDDVELKKQEFSKEMGNIIDSFVADNMTEQDKLTDSIAANIGNVTAKVTKSRIFELAASDDVLNIKCYKDYSYTIPTIGEVRLPYEYVDFGKFDENLKAKLTSTSDKGTVPIMISLADAGSVDAFVAENLSGDERLIYTGGASGIIFAEVAKPKVCELSALNDILNISLLGNYSEIYNLIPAGDNGTDYYNHGKNDSEKYTGNYSKLRSELLEKLSVMNDTDTIAVDISLHETDEAYAATQMPYDSKDKYNARMEKIYEVNKKILDGFTSNNFTDADKVTWRSSVSPWVVAEITKSTAYKIAACDEVEDVAFYEEYLDISNSFVQPSKNTMILGDADSSGAIGVDDALMIFKHIATIETIPDDAVALADINANGAIEVDDALEILRHMAGITSDYSDKIGSII